MRGARSTAVVAAVLTAALTVALAGDAATEGPRTARLEGTASIDRHHRVVGAAVLARARDGGPLFWLTSTDERGFFVLDRLPEGTYRVALHRDGLAPVVKEGIELRFPFRAVVEVTLAPDPAGKFAAAHAAAAAAKRLRLAGTVSVRGAGPLAEVRIQLVRADETEDPRTTLTLRDGSFAIEGMSAGTWRIEVLGAGYLPLRMDLELADDAKVEAVLVQQAANYVAPALDLLPPEEPIPPPAK
jgi:hypothetical protein